MIRILTVLCATATLLTISPVLAVPVTLKYSASLGQSQADGSPAYPLLGSAGAAIDAQGSLWTGDGKMLASFTMRGGKLTLARRVDAPMGINPGAHIMTDGLRVYFSTWDGTVYAIDPALADPKPVKFCSLGPSWRALSMASVTLKSGFPAKAKLFILSGRTIRGIGADGTDVGVMLTLPPPAQGAPYYSTIGIEPSSGDLLVGGYYPDINVYRFAADGTQVKDGGWPRSGFAEAIIDMNGTPWMLATGGGAQSMQTPMDPSTQQSIERDWTFYGYGIVGDGVGGYWYATSQGLIHFDKHGTSLNERIGGLPNVDLVAVNGDGTIIATTERSGRVLRLTLDNDPNAELKCNGNEPWRVGGNWSSTASALVVDGSTFLVLDSKAKQLWRYDPAQADKNQQPWTKLPLSSALDHPRSIAIGASVVWVLDGVNVFEGPHSDLSALHPVNLPGLSDASVAASDGTNTLFVATSQAVAAYVRKDDGTYALRWTCNVQQSPVISLSASSVGVFVATSTGVQLLDSQSGAALAVLSADAIPGGCTPGAIAAKGNWAVLVDAKNARLVRLRVSK